MSSNSNPELEDFELEINAALTYIKHPSVTNAVVNTADLATSYFQYKNKGTDVLPPVVRAISSDYMQLVIERPPQEIKLSYTRNFHEEDVSLEQIYHVINLPWMIYVMRFTDSYSTLADIHVYARKSSILTDDEILYTIPLPNVYTSGEVCLEKVVNESLDELSQPSLQGTINCVLSAFWDSNFNCDAESTNWNMLPAEAREGITQEDYWGLSEDERNEYFLDFMTSKSIEEVLDLNYEPSILPSCIIVHPHYSSGKNTPPAILTIGEWIAHFERTSNVSFNHLPNPFLSFIKNLLAK